MKHELLNLVEVKERVKLCKTSIYQLIKEGTFPRQVQISHSRVAWVASDIDEWIEKAIEASRMPAGLGAPNE
jgi:prophage regulatory protein